MRHMIGVVVFLIVWTAALPVSAADISATDSYTKTITSSDLISGAGTDLKNTYESASNQIDVDISGLWSHTHAISVYKVDSSWNSNLHLYVRRTATGTAGSEVWNGTSYQEVTSTATEFFRADLDSYNIKLQFELTGMSIHIPIGTYSTTVYLTIHML